MFDTILENYRKATESTLKLQQDMLRNWTMQWPQTFGAQTFGLPTQTGPAAASAMPGSQWLEQMSAAQKKWAEMVTDMLNKHRESLDAQYKAGIRTIEEAFKVSEAKDPAQFRRLTEELWRQSFDSLSTVAETQIRELITMVDKMVKYYEDVSPLSGELGGETRTRPPKPKV